MFWSLNNRSNIVGKPVRAKATLPNDWSAVWDFELRAFGYESGNPIT